MRLSAGIAVTRCISGTYHYLLLRAYRYWDFPKGEVEPGESPFSAAQREVHEETGLSQLEFIWGDGYFETKPYGRNKIARYYIALSPAGEVKLGVNPDLGMSEHHEYRWVDYPAAIDLLGPRVREVLEWARRLVGENC
jgi:8-oxo-dGTP pyrophosphatase MutT (NUDIX family)